MPYIVSRCDRSSGCVVDLVLTLSKSDYWSVCYYLINVMCKCACVISFYTNNVCLFVSIVLGLVLRALRHS